MPMCSVISIGESHDFLDPDRAKECLAIHKPYGSPLETSYRFCPDSPTITTTEPPLAEIKQAQPTAEPLVWTSDVKGKAFDRFYQIWLENVRLLMLAVIQEYDNAASDPNQQWLASKGITLTNYYGTGHPSQPNYVAAASGDNYGMDNDDFHDIPANFSTVADLLNTKGISWEEYQEHMPYAGYQGFNYFNQVTYANDYMRKHNPLVSFDSISSNDTALSLIKNFTSFYDDLENKVLPQWAFITPNMTNDAHDTNVTYGSTWLRGFVSNLMNHTYFWDNTLLLLLTFDETTTYNVPTADKYDERTASSASFSAAPTIASVSANSDLPSLGRWDCGANIFQLVADKVEYMNWDIDNENLYINVSLPGPLSEGDCSDHPGNGVLKAVVDAYGAQTPTYNYSVPFPYDAPCGLNVGTKYSRNRTMYVSGVNATGVVGYNASPTATNTSLSSSSSSQDTNIGAASAIIIPNAASVVGILTAVISLL
ncbi:phosphoesterase family-domain-containing protein [Aspergillus granulosus]|uniref:Phosphoesterase family-domain-containing protein n=1 Tax=Aspergillus granulosus TaxID=176169 RepID=A0ABR4HBZ8_9EURO